MTDDTVLFRERVLLKLEPDEDAVLACVLPHAGDAPEEALVTDAWRDGSLVFLRADRKKLADAFRDVGRRQFLPRLLLLADRVETEEP